MIKICPRCGETYIINDKHVGDFVHECNSDVPALDNEDVIVTGNWEDYTGSATVHSADVRYAGATNELFGTRAAIEGEDVDPVTVRGKRASTHRTRQHLEYIEIKEDD